MTAPLTLHHVAGLRELAGQYDILLCDIWGVVHNGVSAYDSAVDALRRFRAQGGTVVLITNAPRPAGSVRHQLNHLNIASDIDDAIVTSGDVTRTLIENHPARRVYHLGPERDAPLFAGLDIEFTGLENCELILCSGLFDDETEGPEDYRDMLTIAAGQGLEMICANPDHVVHRGDRLIYCAGALADLYEQLGGTAIYAGKPHRPIYDLALGAAAPPGATPTGNERVLAIGDNFNTDIAGAADCGFDALFITGGIHSGDVTEQAGDTGAVTIDAPGTVSRDHLIGYQPALCW